MALISLGSGHFSDDPDTGDNSVFYGLLKHVPRDVFDRLVEAHAADARVRRLTTKSQFVALLYGQLEGASSLREIEAGLASHACRLDHLGASAPLRSTLADANALRPCALFGELFGELFAVMAARAHRLLRRSLADTTYLIDSTGLRLDGRSLDWARFSTKVYGIKLHVDADADQPIYAMLSPARVNDITAAQQMPIELGATYVFDLGYFDYAWWAALDPRRSASLARTDRVSVFALRTLRAIGASFHRVSNVRQLYGTDVAGQGWMVADDVLRVINQLERPYLSATA